MKTALACIGVMLMAFAIAGRAAAPGDRVALEQHLGQQLPLQQGLVDEQGAAVRFAQYFDRLPVVLVFAYYHCPNLCDTVLSGTFQALDKTGLQAGRDYRLVVVDIDPHETPADGRDKRNQFTQRYTLPGGDDAVHFLTAGEPAIEAITSAAGFRYYYDSALKQYAHAAGLLVAAPDGRLSRYLYGVRFDPQDLRLALVQAGNGRIGSAVDQLLLLCFQYDPQTGRYGLVIMRVLRVAGVLVVLLLGGFVWLALRRDRRRRTAS